MASIATGPEAAQRPRSPAIVQLTLSLVIAVMLVAVTLTTRQPPPPAIAEFAPQAAEQIKEQPKEQSSEFGSGTGEGDCPPGATCAAGDGAGDGGTRGGGGEGGGTGSPPPVIGPASVKRCVGNPPRQIEDPQSPPCIAYWDDSKGNGGATAPGVTEDEIIIALPNEMPGLHSALTAFFNDRFQFYGRRIRTVAVTYNGTGGADEAKQYGAFASLSQYSDAPFHRRLAQHKIIGIYRTPDFSDSELAAAAPYTWGYTASATQIFAGLGDWACRRLAGQNAKHAGQIDGRPLSASERTFAIFMDRGTPDSTAKFDVLKQALEQCGAKVPFATSYPRFDNDPIRIRNEIASLKAAGVTTAFCLCVSTNLVYLQQQAGQQQYEPEWIISSYPQLVQPDGWSFAPQLNRTFGVSFGPMDRIADDHPVVWAVREGDPQGSSAYWSVGNLPADDIHYRTYLALVSGLQMAGPNLTPQTFQKGLQAAKFPNPYHPIMAGDVGFQGDFAMTNDGAEFWWSVDDPGPYENGRPPAMCWVDGGRRYGRGTWPRGGDRFFQEPCDSGLKSVS